MTAQVEDAKGVRYLISVLNSKETNASILKRASKFYGKKMVKVLKKK